MLPADRILPWILNEFDGVLLDDGICQQLFAHIVYNAARFRWVGFIDLHFQEFADPDVPDRIKPQALEAPQHSCSLGIVDGWFEGYVNFRQEQCLFPHILRIGGIAGQANRNGVEPCGYSMTPLVVQGAPLGNSGPMEP